MKIWIVNHYAVPDTDPGGTRHFSFARRLKAMGHEPAIIASSFSHFGARERFPGSTEPSIEEELAGVPFLWIHASPYNGNSRGRVKNMLEFYRGVKAQAGQRLFKPDVIIGSNAHLLAVLAARQMARKLDVPFVFEVRDLWPESLVDLAGYPRNGPVVRVLSGLEKHLYKRATKIITLLKESSEYIEARGGQGKVVWIPNGIDLDYVPEQMPPIPDGPFTALYAGSHGPANGLDVLLDAAKLAPSVQFCLIGQGSEKNRLIGRVESEGIKNVRFEDPVPKSQIHGLVAKAHVGLMQLRTSPVHRWGLSPNKMWDYMAVGRPIVVERTAPTNPVEEAHAGLTIPPDDAVRLAEGVTSLSKESRATLTEMGANGFHYVRVNHDFDLLSKRLVCTLEEAIACHKSRG